MRKILLAGNPNVGKTTIFNSLTKSAEHTGNFHGVTVEEKSKTVCFENEDITFVDLPGLYSLNSFSYEEEISAKQLTKNEAEIFMIIDANSIRKNLYLCQQLNELEINYKILINNYDFFKKNNNFIDINLLKDNLQKEIVVINAKKTKLNKDLLRKENKKSQNNYNYLEKYVKIVQKSHNLDKKTIIYALNGIFIGLNQEQIDFIKNLYPNIIKDRFDYIDTILANCVKMEKNFIYGHSKLDKFLLNPFVAVITFLLTFFLGFYAIFFLIGPWISGLEERLLNFILINPTMNVMYAITDNVWLIEFIRNGVLNAVVTVISFVPQITLMFIFLSLLEDSGIIARLAYVFDDFLNFFGLNGKALYIMLLGLGCNTMSTTATRNMNEKNLKIKSAIINPYISCMARLPVYMLIASAFFGKKSFFVVFGLYTLGSLVALVVSFILNKTILKSKASELLIEFPPLKGVDLKHIFQVGRTNAVDFFKRIFTIILSMGIIVWILTHTQFNLSYTQDISQSILFLIAEKISWLFVPIGLNNAGVVSALVVGVLAKEMIVSTIAICNNTNSQKALIASLSISTSVINFSIASAVSFLIFSLLYSPCVSNLAVIKKETGKFYMWFSLISQFTIAYVLSFVVYQALTKGILFAIVTTIVITLIMVAIILTTKKVKQNKCLTCGKCKLQ
ncbi:MAG: ferrous iron transport protein B [Clostridia bacterium]|nr:ferrous iron transport protein B [Clostridia bacterium]